MNKLRRVYEKTRANIPAEKKRPPPPPAAGQAARKGKATKDKSPGEEDFKRAVNALWGQAFLALAARAEEEETWE